MESLVRDALKAQYHAALAMLRNHIEIMPDDVWTGGTHPRNPWRIAYHTALYAHLYLMQKEADFVEYKDHDSTVTDLWAEENPPVVPAYSRQHVIGYIDHIDSLVDPTIDAMDLETSDSGFSWYKSVGKLEHLILSIRHIAVHVGQLEQILDENCIDFPWITRAKS